MKKKFIKDQLPIIPMKEKIQLPVDFSTEVGGSLKPDNRANRRQVYADNTAPTGDVQAGDLWFDTDDSNKVYRYDGTDWVSVQDGSIFSGDWDDITGATKPDDNADVTADNPQSFAWLTAGTITSKTIILAVAAGAGDVVLRAGKTDFGDTDQGFILGIDDSDGDKAKFEIGDIDNNLNWNGVALSMNGAIIDTPTLTGIQSGSEIAIQGWSNDLVFSATDYRIVAWASGTITLLDGTTYSISAGNTGNMSALTYIYLDTATSLTVLQTTTTASDAVGSGKILIGIAENNSDTSSQATFQIFGGTGGQLVPVDNIAANSASVNEFVANTANVKDAVITNAKINDLSVAKLTAGSITSKAITLAVAAGTGDSKIQAGKTDFGDTSSGFIIGVDDSDSDKAKLEIGDADYSMIWDGSTLTVNDSLLSFNDNFGDGSDGDVTTSGDVTLTADMYYDTLTVSAGDTLYTAGYRIFCKTALIVNGTIDRKGNAGANGSNQGTGSSGSNGGAGGAALAAATLPGGIAGVSGGGGSGNYTNCAGITDGADGSNQSVCLGDDGTDGGDGGEGSGLGLGGSGGTATQSVQGANILTFLQLGREFLAGGISLFTVSAGGAGGGGACNRTFGQDPGPGGGGSGGSGGYMLISAKTITVSATGIITAEGGDGGDGGSATGSTCSGAGGGAGGNGGVLALVYNKLTNSGSITVDGGTGGTGGTDAGARGVGVNGANGATGKLIQLAI